MNQDLFAVFPVHSAWFTKRFGQTDPWHYLFPFGKPTPNDSSRPITDATGVDSLMLNREQTPPDTPKLAGSERLHKRPPNLEPDHSPVIVSD